MERIKIENTDIFLEDYGDGKGKIIISNTYGYNFSYYWGSMGSSLKDFLLRINEDYFVHKLCTNTQGDFSGKLSVRNIRKSMKENFAYELPWYKNMEAMKELRKLLKNLEDCDEVNSFCYEVNSIRDNYWDMYIDDKWDLKDFKSALEGLFSEVHYYFEYKESNEHRFLKKLFKNLQKELKKNNVLVE